MCLSRTSATWHDGPSQSRSLETSAFEKDGRAVAEGSGPDVLEVFEVAFEVEEELEGGGGELVVGPRPLGVGEGGDGWCWLDGAGFEC